MTAKKRATAKKPATKRRTAPKRDHVERIAALIVALVEVTECFEKVLEHSTDAGGHGTARNRAAIEQARALIARANA